MRSILVWGSITLSFVGCGQSVVSPTPTPTPTPQPTVSSPAPAPQPEPAPQPAPTSVDVSVLVTRTDGMPIAGAEVSLSGSYRGQTDHFGRLSLGSLTIGQSYAVDAYQGQYVPVHTTVTAAVDAPVWRFELVVAR